MTLDPASLHPRLTLFLGVDGFACVVRDRDQQERELKAGQGENKKSRESGPFYTFSFDLGYAAFMAFLRSAQRFFIISEMRRFAAALRRLRPRLPGPAARRPRSDPRRAEIACSRRSLSSSNSEMICCVSI